MKIYKHKGVKELGDSDVSSEFCKKINDVSDAMNSRTPKTGLKPGSEEWKVMFCIIVLISYLKSQMPYFILFFPQIIEDFIEYFKKIRDPVQNPQNLILQKEKAKLQQQKRLNTINAKKKAQGIPEPSTSKQKKKKPPPTPKEPQVAVIFSESTDFGLAVTLKTTLVLTHFLCTKCNYKYLLTCRLNQDCLEVSILVCVLKQYY